MKLGIEGGGAELDTRRQCPHCGETSAARDICSCCEGLLQVAGGFRLGRTLGRGGSATVFEARSDDGIQVAVKVMQLKGSTDFKERDLFIRGTELLASLDHPAVPKVFALEEDAVGRVYQVRQLYEGGSLEDRILVQHQRFDRRDIHRFLQQMLQLLRYLHSRLPPVIHRDIKPSNILFARPDDQHPILVDFDAAMAGAPGGTGTTIVVSPGYSPPEQLVGETVAASDLYSLGATTLFMLTHRSPAELPREGGRPVIDDIVAKLEPATRRVLKKLLEPNLNERYQSATKALDDLAGRPPSLVRRPSPTRTVKEEVTMFGASLFRITVGLTFGLMALLLALYFWRAFVFDPWKL